RTDHPKGRPMPRPRSLPTVPAETTQRALGRPPLIPGDDRAGYEVLLASVSATVGPVDLIEAAWVHDVVDLIWEALRLRRLRAALMTTTAGVGLREVLRSIGVPHEDRSQLVLGWVTRKLDAVGAIDAEFDALGLGMDHVMAETLRARLDVIERIDRMI